MASDAYPPEAAVPRTLLSPRHEPQGRKALGDQFPLLGLQRKTRPREGRGRAESGGPELAASGGGGGLNQKGALQKRPGGFSPFSSCPSTRMMPCVHTFVSLSRPKALGGEAGFLLQDRSDPGVCGKVD